MDKVKRWWNKVPRRYKNFWFWAGLIGTCLAALNVDPQSLTNYGLIGGLIMDVISNPVKTAALLFAIVGVFVNPTTKGLRDNTEVKKDE